MNHDEVYTHCTNCDIMCWAIPGSKCACGGMRVRVSPAWIPAKDVSTTDLRAETNIRRPTFKWREWHERNQAWIASVLAVGKAQGARAAAQESGRHMRDVNAWLNDLPPAQKLDIVQLVVAEAYMLYQLMDPPQGPKPFSNSNEGLEFRERFYEMAYLGLVAETSHWDGGETANRAVKDLEIYAIHRGWLP